MERIELCYNASPDLEWVATEEARKITNVYQRLKQLDSLSVQTDFHAWRFSSELIFYMQGEAKTLESALRTLYQEAGFPVAIARDKVSTSRFWEKHHPTLVGFPSSRRAIEISEQIIKEINPDFGMKGLYVASCCSRHA